MLMATGATAEPYPSDVAESFMAGCREQSDEAICRCVLGKLEETVSLQRLLAGRLTAETLAEHTLACTETTPPQAGWTDSWRAEFRRGCALQYPAAQCECALTKLELALPLADLLAGKLSEEQRDAALSACP